MAFKQRNIALPGLSAFKGTSKSKGWYHACGPEGGCSPHGAGHKEAHTAGKLHDVPPHYDKKPDKKKQQN